MMMQDTVRTVTTHAAGAPLDSTTTTITTTGVGASALPPAGWHWGAVRIPTALLGPSPLPAIVLYVAVVLLVVLVFVFLHGMLRERAARLGGNASLTLGERAAMFGVWLVHPFTGKDGRLSFSKLISCGVLLHYAISANLPAVVACWIIAASFGAKVLLAVIERTGLTAASTTALSGAFSRTEQRTEQDTRQDVKQDVRQTTEAITRTIVEERGPTGEPPRSLPPTGAATPDGER